MQLQILDRPWSDPDGKHLRGLQGQEIDEMYGEPDTEPGTPPSADDISVFVIAYTEDLPNKPIAIACGALRVLPRNSDYPGDVEIKRMYVHHAYRGKPWFAAQAIMEALEERALQNGWTRIVLETGELQVAAIRFYERQGYRKIASFGAYIDSSISICYGKTLETR